MIRWKYLLPRVAIVGAIMMAVWVGGNSLLRWTLIRSGEAITGAKVGIGQVRATLLSGQVELLDVEFADPRHPMRNMLQADRVILRLDPRRLLHREMVIQQAGLSGVLFGTPRTQSGALADNRGLGLEDAELLVDSARSKLQTASQAWLEQLGQQLPQLAENQLETARLGKEIGLRWDRELEFQRDRARRLSQQVRELTEAIGKPHRNPLRDHAEFLTAMDRFHSLEQEIESAHQDLHRLRKQLELDRLAIQEAAAHDRKRVQRLGRAASLDEQSIAEMLLGEQQASRIDEVLSWIHWFQAAIPDPDVDFQPARMRGLDIHFHRRPQLLIEQIQLDGRGRLAGQMFHFAGTASNISNAPKLHRYPATFQLRGQGKSHVMVAATLDRRGPQNHDHLRFQCSGINIPPHRLGSDDSLAIQLQPSQLQFEVEATLVDDQLEGNLVFRSTGVEMEVQHLAPSAGGEAVAKMLNEQLRTINQFTVVVDLTGSLDDPHFDIRSDLTHQLAGVFDRAIEAAWQSQLKQRIAAIEQAQQRETRQLNEMFDSEINQVVEILHSQAPSVARLQDLIPSIKSWPTIR